jgi:hypothetical protein
VDRQKGPFKGHCLHLTSILKTETAFTSNMSAILARSTVRKLEGRINVKIFEILHINPINKVFCAEVALTRGNSSINKR